MQVTDVKIKRMYKNGSLKALVTVVIDDALCIHNIKIIKGERGLFMAMPSRKSDEGFIDFVHPINTETRKLLSDAVLEAYEKLEAENAEV